MFIFKKLRKSNKGFSLVELIITVAMMSIVTAGIGTALVSATQSYNRGTAEVDLQTDSQNLTNIITNLIIDSTYVSNSATEGGTADFKNLYIKSTPALSYENDGSGNTVTIYTYTYYAIKYDSATSTIKYGRSTNSFYDAEVAADSTDSFSVAEDNDSLVILAENVSGFSADASTFSSDFTVHIDIDMYYEATKRSLQTSFSVTSRNAEADGADINADGAIIVINSMLIAEPNQTSDASNTELPITLDTITFDVLRSGNVKRAEARIITNSDLTISAYEQKNFNKTADTVKITNFKQPDDGHLGSFDITIDKDCDYEKVYLYLGTVFSSSDSSPYDEKWVTVYIRRVNTISVSGKKNTGSTGISGSTYTVNSNITSIYNPECFYALTEDNDYVNPYDVYWVITGNSKLTGSVMDYIEFDTGYNPAGLSSTKSSGIVKTTSNKTTIKLKLKKDMPIGGCITFTCYSAHAAGNFEGNNYNKTGISYDTILSSYQIKRTMFDDGYQRGKAVVIAHGLQWDTGIKTFLDTQYSGLDSNSLLNNYINRYGCGSINSNSGIRFDTFCSFGTYKYDETGAIMEDEEGNYIIDKWTPYIGIGVSANGRDPEHFSNYLIPCNEYCMEQVVVLYNAGTKEIYYPKDSRLLEPGMGFYEAGYQFASVGSDPGLDDDGNPIYMDRSTVSRSEITFTGKTIVYSNGYSKTIDDDSESIGTLDSPLCVYANTDITYSGDNFVGLYNGFGGSLYLIIQKYDNGTWTTVGNTKNSQTVNLDNSNSIYYLANGGTSGGYITLKRSNSDDTVYRALFCIKNYSMYNVEASSTGSDSYSGDLQLFAKATQITSTGDITNLVAQSVKDDVNTVLGINTGYLYVASDYTYDFPLFYNVDSGNGDAAGCIYFTFK